MACLQSQDGHYSPSKKRIVRALLSKSGTRFGRVVAKSETGSEDSGTESMTVPPGMRAGSPITLRSAKKKEAVLAKPPLLPGVCSMSGCLTLARYQWFHSATHVRSAVNRAVHWTLVFRSPNKNISWPWYVSRFSGEDRLSGIGLCRGVALALQERFPNTTTNLCLHSRRHRLGGRV